MNSQLIAACTGATISAADKYAVHIALAMKYYSIEKPQRAAMFLANVGHESGGLQTVFENLNYRSSALIDGFGRHRISIDDANKYGRNGAQSANQVEIANRLYGGEFGRVNLGNTAPGDGWKFRGHGLIQNTGRANARRLTQRLRLKFPDLAVPDFEVTPDAISEPLWAALSAGDYWDMRELNLWADAGDFDGVCDRINIGKKTDKYGDSEGWAHRLDIFRAAKVALRIV